jgi:uncharacterized protein YcbK (DUF882 family)
MRGDFIAGFLATEWDAAQGPEREATVRISPERAVFGRDRAGMPDVRRFSTTTSAFLSSYVDLDGLAPTLEPAPDEESESQPIPGEESAEPDPLDGLVDVEPGIKAKQEVDISRLVPELRAQFRVIFEVYRQFGYADEEVNPMVLTSGNDSLDEHARRSYHKVNRAIDVRGKFVPDSVLRKIAAEVQNKLGDGFWVNAEITKSSKYWYKDHLHIEYRGKSVTDPISS